jgi:hypothetical protein
MDGDTLSSAHPIQNEPSVACICILPSKLLTQTFELFPSQAALPTGPPTLILSAISGGFLDKVARNRGHWPH